MSWKWKYILEGESLVFRDLHKNLLPIFKFVLSSFFSKSIIHTVPNQTSISKNSIQHQNKSIEHYPRSIHSLYGTLLNLFLHFALVVSKRGIERGAWCVPVTESKRNKRTKNKKRRGTGGESSLSWRNIRQVFDCIVFCTPGNSDVPGRPRESAWNIRQRVARCSCIRSLSHGSLRSHGWLKTE